MSDERHYNKRGGKSNYHKIRKIVTNNKTGDVYGVTVPLEFATFFKDCKLRIYISGNALIMESGADLTPKEISQEKFEEVASRYLSASY